ncbi:nuclear transport factor 2 family protein [Carboxylicivirga sediminis]|uniref:Nuclear transport factor 2 family protein n=1 Tax=Carboxylicivirga sediminis TaxID=2006564 RepID=A0A941IVL0_9BACT|nr:nuclear transport factor 2 family protein [Carboxylicivirga sediminis]MBR8534088.1 nuclear transport factor 2 family protein [Carboxylicivirga sediminis]
MKKYILLFTAALIGFTSFAQSDIKEEMAIKRVIESAYLDGVQNIGDMAKIDAGFHPDFRMQVLNNNGRLSNVSLTEFKQRVKNNMVDGVLPRKVGKHVSVDYLSIDISNNAATIKMDYILEGKSVYIDYMQLYKFPDGWKIVNKIYHTVEG